MNLRIRDHFVYWFHQGMMFAGGIRAPSLDEIRRDGFHRVLVTATTAIGDAVLCMPLIDSLRTALPKVKIGFWVAAGAASLFEGRRGLDRVLSYHGKYRRVRETMKLLRGGQYDLALVANANDPDVIPMIWWSGCRRIIRRPQRNTIYSFMIANPGMLNASHTSGHAIERNLEFCDLLQVSRGEARTRLEIQPGTEARIYPLLQKVSPPLWCIHPGSTRSPKQWGAGRYAELAQRILKKSEGTILITGSQQEKAICDEVKRGIGMNERVCNLAARLRLDELAAMLKHVHLLVSGDTGPYHIAMALDVPTVTLFAPWDIGSSSSINGPYFDRKIHRTVETSKIGDPISNITVDQVFEACLPFLAKAETTR